MGRLVRNLIPAFCISVVIGAVIVFSHGDDLTSGGNRSFRTQEDNSRDFRTEDGGSRTPCIQPSRQVVLSLGQNPRTIYISWKGNSQRAEYIRVAEAGEDLPQEAVIKADIRKDLSQAAVIKADIRKTLGGEYYRNSVRLDGLDPGKTYYYEIGDEVAFDCIGSFTVPDERGETKFLYLGDIQFDESLNDYARWGNMTAEIYAKHPSLDFAVIGGDMINSPTKENEWNAFFDNTGIFGMLPLMTAAGNHEGVSSNSTYRKMFKSPANGPSGDAVRQSFYFFDYGQCRIVVTDSSFLTKQRKETLGDKKWKEYESLIESWLQRVLRTSDKKWNIVVTHHPPYGMHDYKSVSKELRQLWVPIMEAGGTDLVLCGHQHLYMRTEKINGIVYVMGNSGMRRSEFYNAYNAPKYSDVIYDGGPNYQIIRADHDELQIVSYNEEGLIIDETLLKKAVKLPHFRSFL